MSSFRPDRRDLLGALLATGGFFLLPKLAQAAGPALGPAHPFSFEGLKETARALAAQPWQPAEIPDAAVLDQIDYDRHNQIRFRKDGTLWLDQGNRPPVQPFFPGTYFRQPVRLHAVENGMAREMPFDLDLFDIPEDNPARNLTHTSGFAGFRVMDAKTHLDWMAFLGASYWRTSGYSGQFGLSVRGLAMDTAINGPEEFPLFTRFWLEPADNGDLTAYALMESPRATGAYRIVSRRDNGIVQDVTATLWLRGDVERLGIAPLTSMFWYGKNNRFTGGDWRPEIHDSDGLEIHAANGERIWRPLNNPPHTMVNTFAAPDVKGFGLMQRERDFEHYQDDGVFYEKRASVWVEPMGHWGDGTVTLVELRTDDEIHDNIVAFWQPGPAARAGNSYDVAYRLSWLEDCPVPAVAARFTATRLGIGGVPGQPRPHNVVKVVCDLENRGLEGLGRGDGVELDVTVSRGVVGNTAVYPVVGTNRWRAMFDIDWSALPEGDLAPIDIRAHVHHAGAAKSETLLMQLFPSQIRRLHDQRA
ncbi:glucans biosynthesis protein [Gemmobacter megaterium]|uniref:Glucans biosynthesis protein n=1 Tax=Gemmobacter megaterium TaxID=1086013 RepID=A0A1N7QRG9_9RHOB|nr:glucan biosynthesis protein D [Gemmobacter megaterium]GGE29101.1 glucan biosynthesis protein D [Gemmobacter megaterium]SIT25505.1 glucans biosynthesis protein [Gemmobacter megaterium]